MLERQYVGKTLVASMRAGGGIKSHVASEHLQRQLLQRVAAGAGPQAHAQQHNLHTVQAPSLSSTVIMPTACK